MKPSNETSRRKEEEKQPLLNKTQPQKNDVEAQQKEENVEKNNRTLVVAFCLMLIFQLGNRIFGKLETFPMHNYPLFLNLMSTVIYVPICFAYIIPVLMLTDVISKDQTDIPKYKFAVMGLLDSIAGIMATFAVNYITNSSIIVLVQQSAIPISMVISFTFLKARYSISQYVGAFIVLLGIVAVLIPSFFGSGDASNSMSDQLPWIGMLVLACVPMCFSSVYKEKALGEVDIDVIYLNGWVAIFQSICAIPLCIPSAYLIGLPMNQIMPNLTDGFKCWWAINSVTTAEGNFEVDNCAESPFYVNTYLCFNVVFNVLIILILKHGSANIMFMASTVIVPLSNVVFSLKFMPNHTTLQMFDWVGLAVIMTGLVIYRFMGAIQSLWLRCTGKLSSAEIEEQERLERIGREAEGKQLKFIGINQVEAVETLMDSRILTLQRVNLFRSPQQIRSTYLTKLGIPASPQVTVIPPKQKVDKKTNKLLVSPAIPMRNYNAAPSPKFPTRVSNQNNNSNSGLKVKSAEV